MLVSAGIFYAPVNYLTYCKSAYILKFVNYPVMHILVSTRHVIWNLFINQI